LRPRAIVDTGPLVAVLDARDAYHGWTVEQLRGLRGPLVTCEAVLSEAFFLLREVSRGPARLLEMVRTGGVVVGFALPSETRAVSRLMAKYSDVPMSLADGCLVRMSELNPKHQLLTLDGDFTIYRRNRNRAIPAIIPPGRQ
jgi:predicted nucleic acid-binding protein